LTVVARKKEDFATFILKNPCFKVGEGGFSLSLKRETKEITGQERRELFGKRGTEGPPQSANPGGEKNCPETLLSKGALWVSRSRIRCISSRDKSRYLDRGGKNHR